MFAEIFADLVLAMKAQNKKEIESIYNTLARAGMDRMTVNILLRDREIQIEIMKELKRRKDNVSEV